MKKFAMILTILAVFANSPAMAQYKGGQGAATSTRNASDSNFAWGIGLGALAVVGVVVGVIASSGSDTHSSQH